MELALNIEWMVLAIAMCLLWTRHARHEGQSRAVQFVSLGLVLVTMFVVITMYDDMATAQNPAEVRCFQREDDLGVHLHVPLHPVVASTPAVASVAPFNAKYFAVPGSLLLPTANISVFSSIQNRPPPES